MQVTLVLYF